jgi:ABC-type Fe3+ transport system permease subunit
VLCAMRCSVLCVACCLLCAVLCCHMVWNYKRSDVELGRQQARDLLQVRLQRAVCYVLCAMLCVTCYLLCVGYVLSYGLELQARRRGFWTAAGEAEACYAMPCGDTRAFSCGLPLY